MSNINVRAIESHTVKHVAFVGLASDPIFYVHNAKTGAMRKIISLRFAKEVDLLSGETPDFSKVRVTGCEVVNILKSGKDGSLTRERYGLPYQLISSGSAESKLSPEVTKAALACIEAITEEVKAQFAKAHEQYV